MNPKVTEKIKAILSATRTLERASESAGRIAIRNARRSLWARVRAFQEECDVQFSLPVKSPPASHMTWEGKAQRMTVAGFDREIAYPTWWIQDLRSHAFEQDKPRVAHFFERLGAMVSKSCAEYGVPPPMIEPEQVGALNLAGSGHLGIKGSTFSNFIRALSKWILWQQGELEFRKKKRTGSRHRPRSQKATDKDQLTKNGIADVNAKMVEILRLNGFIETEKSEAA